MHPSAFLDAQEGIPPDVLTRLKALTPATYIGLAESLAKDV